MTTTETPEEYCPFLYYNLTATNPCDLHVCKNSTDNINCREGVYIYCKQSQYFSSETELGCIQHKSSDVTSTTTRPIVETTTNLLETTPRTTTKVYEIETTTDVGIFTETTTEFTRQPETTTYAIPASKTTTTTTRAPEVPFCPFKYFDLHHAKNPCQLHVCQNDTHNAYCLEGILLYCQQSTFEQNETESGCFSLTIGTATLPPSTTTKMDVVTTTDQPIVKTTTKMDVVETTTKMGVVETTTKIDQPSIKTTTKMDVIETTTKSAIDDCPFSLEDTLHSPCYYEDCITDGDSNACKQFVINYCKNSLHGHNDDGCLSIIAKEFATTTMTSTEVPFTKITTTTKSGQKPVTTTKFVGKPVSTTKKTSLYNCATYCCYHNHLYTKRSSKNHYRW
jgi:hypothetical protein